MTMWYKLATVAIIAIALFEGHSRYVNAVQAREDSLKMAQSQVATLSAQYAELGEQKEALARERSQAPALWQTQDDGTPPVGEAQNTLVEIANKSGAVLKSLSADDDRDIGLMKSMRMVLEVEADVAQWQVIMKQIHENVPTILPVAVEMRRLNRNTADTDYSPTLVRFTLDFPFLPDGTL